mmetsp:Transcript_29329/g.61544  ORF Transcript_29329/g.61544 Transcript_29329/m.61544 type:complete len:105 (-) Transcript_29329:288-602(-)
MASGGGVASSDEGNAVRGGSSDLLRCEVGNCRLPEGRRGDRCLDNCGVFAVGDRFDGHWSIGYVQNGFLVYGDGGVGLVRDDEVRFLVSGSSDCFFGLSDFTRC